MNDTIAIGAQVLVLKNGYKAQGEVRLFDPIDETYLINVPSWGNQVWASESEITGVQEG